MLYQYQFEEDNEEPLTDRPLPSNYPTPEKGGGGGYDAPADDPMTEEPMIQDDEDSTGNGHRS